MAEPRDRTDIWSPQQRFQSTIWSTVMQLRTQDQQRRRLAMDELMNQYWMPVYCYLRRKGHEYAAAQDLTQGFFTDSALGRDLFTKSEPSKGRFRVYLLKALENYVRTCHRDENRLKRQASKTISLEYVHAEAMVGVGGTPEEIFTYAWASEVLSEVLTEVRERCQSDGLGLHFQAFELHVVRPILAGEKPVSLDDLCRELAIGDKRTASNMIITIKRRFQDHFRRKVASLVDDPRDVEDEILQIMHILSKSGADI